MDRTERFYKIEMMIRTRGCVSMSAMLQEIEVSHATLKRDLLYLRDRMDAPIVYDYFDRGYRLQADQRDARQVNHQLPGVWFSEPEIHALPTMHQLLQGLDDGGVLARHLQPLLGKRAQRDDRARRVAAAPGALPQHLVSGRLVPSA